jgi:hypothetical protein
VRVGTSRNRHSSLLVVGICLGVYVVLAVCFHWLTQRGVVTAYGVVASKPSPTTAVVSSDARFMTPAPPEQPSPVPSEPSMSARVKPPTPATVTLAAVPPETVEIPAVAPKKAPKNRVARTAPRREQSVKSDQTRYGTMLHPGHTAIALGSSAPLNSFVAALIRGRPSVSPVDWLSCHGGSTQED